MSQMLVLKPGYSFVDFDDKGGHKVIAHRPADPEKWGTDAEYSYPVADPRIGENQLHKFYPAGNPDAAASAHREATNKITTHVPDGAEEELDSLAEEGAAAETEPEAEEGEEPAPAEGEEEEAAETEEDPLAGLEA